MACLRRGILGSLILMALSVLPAWSAIKVIVVVGRPYFALADPGHTASNTGTQVCVSLELRPYTQDERRVTECGVRLNLDAATACDAIKTLVINRVLAEYGVAVVPSEVLMHGCLH